MSRTLGFKGVGMDERRQSAVAGPGTAATGAAGAAVARKYPRPPALWIRLLALCFRPESWAEAARYPLWVTLLSLIAALFIGAFGSGIGAGREAVRSLALFGRNYDAHYSALELNGDGQLSVRGEWKGPIRIGSYVIDPTGKTDLESVPPTVGALVGASTVSYQMIGLVAPIKTSFPFSLLMPEKGAVTVINGAYINDLVKRRQSAIFLFFAVGTFFLKLLAESLWIAVTMYLISPMVIIGAAVGGRGLMIPRRVAYRIAGAVLVPLVIFSGILQATGYPASATLGEEGALLLWCAAACAMAAYAGVLARRLYVPANRQEPRT
jgi:hypothetical protein